MPPLDHVKNDNDVLHVPVGEWITGKASCDRTAVQINAKRISQQLMTD